MKQLSNQIFWNNSLMSWFIALGIIVAGLLVIKISKYFVVHKLKKWAAKTTTNWDNYLVDAIEHSVIPLLYAVIIYSAINTLLFSPKIDKWMHGIFMAVISFFVIKMISKAFRQFVHLVIKKQGAPEGKEKQASGLIVIVTIAIWMLGIIFFIDNLGYDVTTLIAGLGIGGIAIALAAQTILGDLFSYFVIFFDRPFEIGDFITVDDKSGVVQHVGIKTTRITTLGGEQLICSNTDLTNARVHNYKRLAKRRVLFSLGVTYQTTHAVLAEIPGIVKEIIMATDLVAFDRGHFSSYGNSALNFEFVYYIQTPDYNTYMDKQQEIFLQIFKTFEEKNIEFAYPTQTLFIPEFNC